MIANVFSKCNDTMYLLNTGINSQLDRSLGDSEHHSDKLGHIV
jgi:hypothetical protein